NPERLTAEEARKNYEEARDERIALSVEAGKSFNKDVVQQSAEYEQAEQLLKVAQKKYERALAEHYFASGGHYIADSWRKTEPADYYSAPKLASREYPDLAFKYGARIQELPSNHVETPTLNEPEPQNKLAPDEASMRYKKATDELFALMEVVNRLYVKGAREQSDEYKKADEVAKEARKKQER